MFEAALIELNKREAPSLLLEDYNYFANKAVNQFINKAYNAYDVNQQKTDDLRVLKGSVVLAPVPATEWAASDLFDKTYDVDLPDDYLHILNCIVEYTVQKQYKCYNAGMKWQQGAKRATADMLSQLLHNYYMRPSYKNPYYYINNINTDLINPISTKPTDVTYTQGTPGDLVQKSAEYRYGNRSKVRMEIRYGKDDAIFKLSKVYVDYLRSPQFIRLTQEEVDAVEDTSQLLEFPDYVAQEIVNELIHLLMENASDPRLQSHIPINQSIASPQQEQPRKK
jgi:hypothetical protein